AAPTVPAGDASPGRPVAGAECGDFRAGGCAEGKTAPRDTVCGAARDACDTEEVCDGVSAACPADLWPRGGAECEDASGYGGSCFEGRCVTRGGQCEELSAAYGIDFVAPSESCVAAGGCSAPRCGDANNSLTCYTLDSSTVADGIVCGVDSYCLGAPASVWTSSTSARGTRTRPGPASAAAAFPTRTRMATGPPTVGIRAPRMRTRRAPASAVAAAPTTTRTATACSIAKTSARRIRRRRKRATAAAAWPRRTATWKRTRTSSTETI